MDILAWMVGQAGVVSDEAELRQHLRNKHRGGLLTVHPDSEGLRAPQKEEGIEGRERIPDRVDDEGDFLQEGDMSVKRK